MFFWSKSYSKFVDKSEFSVSEIWNVWIDIKNWSAWQNDLEWSNVEKDFEIGNKILFKLKNQKDPICLDIFEIVNGKKFTDLCRFPGAKMYGMHEFIEYEDKIEIRTTMTVKGLLCFVWRKIVAENIVNDLEKQTNALIARVRHLKNSN